MDKNLFNTIIFNENEKKVIESKQMLDDLESRYPNGIDVEKTGLRKQIDLIKLCLKKATNDENKKNIKAFIYEIKVASLKLDYFIMRKYNDLAKKKANLDKANYYLRLKDFLKEKLNQFIEDIDKIRSFNGDNEIKKLLLKKSIRVYKDFLNAVIVKSYIPSYEANKKNQIQNQRPNRPPHRSW
jgi:hypothetical protein